MDKQNKINYIPWIFLFSSILIIYWSFGQKATFYYLLFLLSGMIVYRYDEIRELVNKKEKQVIYYPNLKYEG